MSQSQQGDTFTTALIGDESGYFSEATTPEAGLAFVKWTIMKMRGLVIALLVLLSFPCGGAAGNGPLWPAPGYAWMYPNRKNDLSVRWQPGLAYLNRGKIQWPHVLASTTKGYFIEAPGYTWAHLDQNRQPISGDFAVYWQPGVAFGYLSPGSIKWPHVISSTTEGLWGPAPGYVWARSDQWGRAIAGDFTVHWQPGMRYEYLGKSWPLVASGTEGTWFPAPGYMWTHLDQNGEPIDLAVHWQPGAAYFDRGNVQWPDVIASTAEDYWFPAPGYTWTHLDQNGQPIAGDFAVRWQPGLAFEYLSPGNIQWPHVVSLATEGLWGPAPGYVWARSDQWGRAIAGDLTVLWQPGTKYEYLDKSWPLVASSTEGRWLPAPGYEWAQLDQNGNAILNLTPARLWGACGAPRQDLAGFVVSNDGVRDLHYMNSNNEEVVFRFISNGRGGWSSLGAWEGVHPPSELGSPLDDDDAVNRMVCLRRVWSSSRSASSDGVHEFSFRLGRQNVSTLLAAQAAVFSFVSQEFTPPLELIPTLPETPSLPQPLSSLPEPLSPLPEALPSLPEHLSPLHEPPAPRPKSMSPVPVPPRPLPEAPAPLSEPPTPPAPPPPPPGPPPGPPQGAEWPILPCPPDATPCQYVDFAQFLSDLRQAIEALRENDFDRAMRLLSGGSFKIVMLPALAVDREESIKEIFGLEAQSINITFAQMQDGVRKLTAFPDWSS